MQRRHFLASMGALAASATLGSAWAGPGSADAPDARFVVLVLRGGLDGLAAVAPYGDPRYRSARGDLALPSPRDAGGVLDLDGTFGLHPALAPLAPMWEANHLLVAHAVAPPYRERSHFDGQDVLEGGGTRPFAMRTGWLSRAMGDPGQGSALAIGKTVPLILRGAPDAASLDPLRTPRPNLPLHAKVAAMYEGDTTLSAALDRGMAAQRLLARHTSDDRKRGKDPERSARVLARLLGDPEGPRTAVLSLGGWDTHSNQSGRLSRQLGTLADTMAGFADELSPALWDRTVMLVITEFGRTIEPNGTGGTDHGVGGVALLAGGAVAGGQVVTDWPSLAKRDRLEERDLRPTTDLRAIVKGVLHDHLKIATSRLSGEVFPDSAGVAPVSGLVRG